MDEHSEGRVVIERVERRNFGRLGTTLVPGDTPPRRPAVRRPALVAVRLAQALAWHEEVLAGSHPSFAAIARREGMAPQRLAQLLDLTLLAPDLQEQVLFLESEDGVEPVSECLLRSIAAEPSWQVQRASWPRVQRSLRTEAA